MWYIDGLLETHNAVDRTFCDAIKGDFETFVHLLREGCNLWNVRGSVFCLMSNHYHALIQTPQSIFPVLCATSTEYILKGITELTSVTVNFFVAVTNQSLLKRIATWLSFFGISTEIPFGPEWWILLEPALGAVIMAICLHPKKDGVAFNRQETKSPIYCVVGFGQTIDIPHVLSKPCPKHHASGASLSEVFAYLYIELSLHDKLEL